MTRPTRKHCDHCRRRTEHRRIVGFLACEVCHRANGVPLAEKLAGLEPVVCAMVGCENVVPFHEWPRDSTLPRVCSSCLRANQVMLPPRRQQPHLHDLDSDFEQLVSS